MTAALPSGLQVRASSELPRSPSYAATFAALGPQEGLSPSIRNLQAAAVNFRRPGPPGPGVRSYEQVSAGTDALLPLAMKPNWVLA